MLNQRTLEKLLTMKLHGMADAFRAQLETTDTSQLGFEERFAMLVEQQWLWKKTVPWLGACAPPGSKNGVLSKASIASTRAASTAS